MNSETFIDNDRYDFEIKQVVGVLNRFHAKRIKLYPAPVDTNELFGSLHISIRIGGMVDLGELCIVNGRVEPKHKGELVKSLVDLEPDPSSGECEMWQVRYLFAMHGIYAERHRPKNDSTAYEAVHELPGDGKLFNRQLLENVAGVGAIRW